MPNIAKTWAVVFNTNRTCECRRIVPFLLVAGLFLFSALSRTANAATYYVDFESGDNSAVGTSPDTAWKHAPGDSKATANPASLRLQPGDTVLFKGRVVYRGYIRIESGSGTVGNHITYKGNGWPGLEGIKATIDGSEILTGWTACESQEAAGGNENWANIYYAYAPAEAEVLSSNLYQDQEPLAISQHPDPLDPFSIEIKSTYLQIPLSDVTRTSLIDSRLETFGENLIGSYLAIHAYSSDVIYRKITDYNSVTYTLFFEDLGKDPSTEPCSYSILNSLDANVFDGPGEYYLNETPEPDGRHKVYIWPLKNPNDSEITVSVRDIGLYTNINYITIEGFILQKAKVHIIQTSSMPEQGLVFRNNEVSKIRAAAKTDAIGIRGFSDVVIENNYVHDTSNARGISISGSNILVKNSTFTNIGGTVMLISGGDNNRIIGNYIHDCRGSHANGISTYAGPNDVLVANNTVVNVVRPYTFSAFGGDDDRPIGNIIAYNNIFDTRGLGGTVVDQFCERTIGSIIFMNNIIIGSESDGGLSIGGGDATYIVKNNILDGWGNNSYDRSNNIYTGLGWSQTKEGGWAPGPGSIVDTGTDGEYDEVDMTTVFVNMPAYEAQIFAVIDVSTFYLYAEEWTDRIQVGDIIEYNEDGIARTVTSKEDIRDADYSSWRWFTKITFEPSVLMEENRVVAIWKNNTNFIRDIRLKPRSIVIDAGIDVTPYLADAIRRFPDYDFYTDIEGNPRPQGTGFDIGAYEYVPSGSGNSAPVLNAIGNKTINENSTSSFSVSATDADSDTITYSATGTAIDAGATFTSQTFNWTPDYGQAGSYQATFIVSDGNDQDSETITITVNNTNRAPELAPIGDKPASENSTLSFSISATDPDGETITYSAPNLPSGAVLSAETGAFSWTPNYEQAGDYEVTFIAGDGQAEDSEAIIITVANTNRTPVLSSIGDRSVYLGNSLGFTISAIDPDGDTITYSATDLPDGATFEGQSFSWTPDSNQTGSYDVTFYARDSQSEDSEEITITVAADSTAPTVSGLSPAADSIQAPLNSLISLYITDDGTGVDAATVTIKVNGNLVYSGDTADYDSPYGHCRRTGTKASYRYFYQADELFDYDQLITVTVNASDLAGNPIAYSYSFTTEMRSFGANKAIVPDSCDLDREVTATASDSSGNVWVVWQQGQAGSRNIRLARLADGAETFGDSVQLTNDDFDQCNAGIAVDADDKLYVVWQGNNTGNWGIYISTSTDGTKWSTQKKITDSGDNQTNPAIAVDNSAPTNAYVVWEDDRNGNSDIYAASSGNDFLTGTVWAITSEQSEQSEPAIAVDANNTVYVVWTDEREGSKDIYGASSGNGPWTNLAVVSDAGNTYNQSSPAIAIEDTGSRLHLLWADDSGEDYDIFYAQTSGGLPSSPLTGSSIVDDTTDADQLSPAIAVSGSTGDDLCVFACWLDERDSDSDLYFVKVGSGSGTNVFIGDGSTNSNQDTPVMGLDKLGYPYLVWTDDRNSGSDIYYAASTYIDPQALAQEQVSAANGAVIGVSSAQVSHVDDVSVSMPAGAWQCDVKVTVSKMRNIQEFLTCNPVANYDIGPSGINFNEPVTVIIPYNVSDYPGPLIPYCYGPQEHNPSQDGITAIEKLVISASVHAMRFQATHFSQFILASDTEANEPNVVWRFGTFGDQRKVKLAVTGLDDSPLNLSLRGSGYGEVIQGDGLSQIVLYDTTGGTSLRISSKNRKSGGAVGDIVVNGSLKDIKAKGISLEGDLTVTGSAGKVTLGNVSGSNITICSTSNPSGSVSIRLGRVSDSNINSRIPIRDLTAIDWLDNDSTTDQITAPSIGKLKITGSRRGGVAGDFSADVILTGNMGKASIAGSLIDSDWSVDGCIAALAVKGASENCYVCSTGSIASIILGAAYDSDFLAGFDLDYDEQWPAAVSGFLTTVARISSFTITGLKTQPGEYYFVNTNVSAPSIGRVCLLNLQTQNSGYDFGLWTLDNSAENILASVSNKSTIDNDESFTLKQGDGIPGNVNDFRMEILEP